MSEIAINQIGIDKEHEKRINADRIAELKVQIEKHWNEVEDHIDEMSDRARKACLAAWKCGQCLNEVKSLLPHGKFLPWLQAEGIPERSARHYMKVAAKWATVADLPETIQECYYQLGIKAPKMIAVGDSSGAIDRRPFHHLSFINRWHGWLNQVRQGRIQMDLEQTKQDLKPLYIWMKNEVFNE